MRRLLATAVGITGLSLIASTACIHPASCLTLCETTFDVNAHVAGAAASLAGASVTFCRNNACASATLGAATDAGVVAPTPLTGAPFSAQATVTDERDGFTLVGIELDVDGLAQTDGDTYSVKIADSTGTALLDVTRPVNYDVVQSCGLTCLDYSMDVYATSTSGIACGDKTCVSGATITGTITTSNTTDMVEISLCRNSVCGTSALSLMGITPQQDGEQGNLTGSLAGQIDVQALTSEAFPFQIYLRDDPAALTDSDTLTLSIQQGSTSLVSWSGAVPYQTSFPNGMQCDPFPCRFATVDVP